MKPSLLLTLLGMVAGCAHDPVPVAMKAAPVAVDVPEPVPQKIDVSRLPLESRDGEPMLSLVP